MLTKVREKNLNIDYSSHWGDSLNSNRQKSQEKDVWMLIKKLNNSLWQENDEI